MSQEIIELEICWCLGSIGSFYSLSSIDQNLPSISLVSSLHLALRSQLSQLDFSISQAAAAAAVVAGALDLIFVSLFSD